MRTHLAKHTSPRSRSHNRVTVAAVTLGLALAVAGCGADDTAASEAGTGGSTAPSESPAATPTQPRASATSSPATPRVTGPQLRMTVAGDKVTPRGKELKLGVGKTLTITVDSDRAGELHVHSSPEQELSYTRGTTTLELKIDRPGVVDVEDHVADALVAQLEVS